MFVKTETSSVLTALTVCQPEKLEWPFSFYQPASNHPCYTHVRQKKIPRSSGSLKQVNYHSSQNRQMNKKKNVKISTLGFTFPLVFPYVAAIDRGIL